MSKKSYRQAINEALRQEMERDPRVILMGEDVAGGMGAPGEDDAWGGPLGVTKGLMPIFGRDRQRSQRLASRSFPTPSMSRHCVAARLRAHHRLTTPMRSISASLRRTKARRTSWT